MIVLWSRLTRKIPTLALLLLFLACVTAFQYRNAHLLSSNCIHSVDTLGYHTNEYQLRKLCEIPPFDAGPVFSSKDAKVRLSQLRGEPAELKDQSLLADLNLDHQGEAAGRFYLTSQLTLDLVFPFIYALLLFRWTRDVWRVIRRETRREEHANDSKNRKEVRPWLMLPLLAGLADIIENLLIVAAVGLNQPWLILVTSIFTSIKWILVIASIGHILWPMRDHIRVARVPLIALGLLLVLGTLGGTDNMFVNALKMTNNHELFRAALFTTLASGVLLFCFLHAWNLGIWQVKQENGYYEILRFGARGNTNSQSLISRAGLTALLALPLLYKTWMLSDHEHSLPWWPSVSGALLGLGILAFLESQRVKLGHIRTLVRYGDKTNGFFEQGVVRPGHLMALIYALLLLFIYGLGFYHGYKENWWSVLSYVLLLITFAGFALTFFAFLVDRTRLPLLISIIVAVAVSSSFSDYKNADHYFEVQRAGPATAPTIDDYIDELAADPPEVLTVVSATGGGIQAAAWTTYVLSQLRQNAASVNDTIGFISATSGGAVGTWLYAQQNEHCGGDNESEGCRDEPYTIATQDSLRATAWGLAFPDLTRSMVPQVAGAFKTIDRAWAMERSWMKHCESTADFCMKDATLDDITSTAVVLNSTVVETGYPLLLSNYDLAVFTPCNDGRKLFDTQPLTVRNDSNHCHPLVEKRFVPRLETSARLSATFPYVTPVSAPLVVDNHGTEVVDTDLDTEWHAIDGGLLDNNGTFAAVSFIERALTHDRLRNTRFVLVELNAYNGSERRDCPVTIESSKSDESTSDACLETFSYRGAAAPWWTASVEPILGLFRIRQTGQNLRGEERIATLAAQLGCDFNQVSNCERFRVISFSPMRTLGQPPLSWQLAKQNLKYISQSFDSIWEEKCEELKSAFNNQALCRAN